VLRAARTQAQRAARRAWAEAGAARAAWRSAAAAGSAAATSLVNAVLLGRYAPDWPLPPAVASQPGLAEAIAEKLAAKGAAASAALFASLAQLGQAQAALAAAAAQLGAVEEAEALGEAVVCRTLSLWALGAPARRCAASRAHPRARADALLSEVAAMHAAELAGKEEIARELRALLQPPAEAAAEPPPPPSREQLAALLRCWRMEPALDVRRLQAIDRTMSAEVDD